jgi:hypothetical protein
MDAGGKALVIGAVITAAGGVVAALVTQMDVRPPPLTVTCDPLPPIEQTRPPKPGSKFVWVPADFRLVAGKLEPVPGYWKRYNPTEGKYVQGHWSIDTGRCVWIPGRFENETPTAPEPQIQTRDHRGS